MDKLSLVIVEDNKDLCEILATYITDNHSEKFSLLGTANDGSEGLRLICEKKPDIALIDIVLPVIDGLCILEKLSSLDLLNEVCCVMLTAVSHDDITKRCMELGARYYFLKPFDMETLVRRLTAINKLHNSKRASNSDREGSLSKPFPNRRVADITPEKYSTIMLQSIAIPANLTGYYYLRRAIVLCINDETLLDGLTKVLYPSIGKEFKTTGQRVERSIRHSIEKAWKEGCAKNYYRALGRVSPENILKPSNGLFIMALVDYYKTNYTMQ